MSIGNFSIIYLHFILFFSAPQINGQTGKMPAMPITLSENSYVDLKKKESTIMSPTASTLNKRDSSMNSVTESGTTTCSSNGISYPVETNTATTTTATLSYRHQQHCTTSTTSGLNRLNNNVPTPVNNVQQQSVPIKRSANDFRFGKSIGEGSFSTVYLAKDIHTQKEYASKFIQIFFIIYNFL
jgi:hypothetical protein